MNSHSGIRTDGDTGIFIGTIGKSFLSSSVVANNTFVCFIHTNFLIIEQLARIYFEHPTH
jgi:hypothetical protein